MSELRAVMTKETEKARQFKVGDRLLWIPKSVTNTITKFAPDSNGHRECILDLEDWYCAKEDL